jgi:hypothetical protein
MLRLKWRKDSDGSLETSEGVVPSHLDLVLGREMIASAL